MDNRLWRTIVLHNQARLRAEAGEEGAEHFREVVRQVAVWITSALKRWSS